MMGIRLIPARDLLPALLGLATLALPHEDAVADVILNEVMAVNDTVLADEAGEFDDWVELHNTGDTPLDAGGLYLSDDPSDPALWQIPQNLGDLGDFTVIPAKGHLLLWLDGDPEQGPLHAPFRLSGAGATLVLTHRDGSTVLDEIVLPPQHPDIAFGRPHPESEAPLFLVAPTPAADNDPTGVSQLGGVTASVAPSTFSQPFELTLSTTTDGGSIKFTTNGSDPGLFSGANFTAPLTISQSTAIRAAVFIGSKRISPVTTWIYLATDDEVRVFSSDLPLVFIDSRGHDFTRDTSLSTTFEPTAVSSLFLEPGEDGRATLSGPPNYFGNAGMNVRGASSRAWPKKQYKFETWGEQSEDRPASLLGMPADADWILAAPYFDRSLMRNHLTFRWWEALGYYSPRTRFFELFLDQDGDRRFTMDDYQGIYVLTEKIKRSADRLDLPRLKPADGDDASPPFTGSYVIEGTNVNQHWQSRSGIRLKYLEPREAELLPEAKAWIRDHYNAVEATVLEDEFQDAESGYRSILDVPSHIDYDILRELSRNIDGASTFLSFNAEGKIGMGPLWDYNQSFGLTSLFKPEPGWKTDGWNVEYMTRGGHWMKWWDHLGNDPEYQTAWNDRWVELRQGLFTNDRLLGDVAATAALLEESQERNFERWDILGKVVWSTGGGTRADPAEGERDTFAKEVAFVRDWLTARLAWIDSQVPAPPSFNRSGGAVPRGFSLEMGEGEGFKKFGGVIHYTTDGSDPRDAGGGIHASASRYGEPLTLTEEVVLSARARSIFGKWSSLRRATFLVDVLPANASNLTIAEIHYNPRGSDDLEFIELTNRGNEAIDLTGVRLEEAVNFTFGPRSLQPGAVVLIVEDQEAFAAREGIDFTLVAGQWEGALSNGGESLRVVDAQGNEILSFTYEDRGEWPRMADGQGRSLERTDLHTDALDDAMSWHASVIDGGTPGVLAPEAPSSGKTYLAWQADLLGDVSLKEPGDDPDTDGQVNLLEFAFATDPLDPNSIPQIEVASIRTGEPGTIALQISHSHADSHEVRLTAEISPDLRSWTATSLSEQAPTEGHRHLQTPALPKAEARYFRFVVSLPIDNP